jgi:predicted HTH transcriptional regulator
MINPAISKQDFESPTFKEFENNCFEFKENIHLPQGYSKYLETLCGFLNTRGGYLIFGINDSGALVGIQNDLKEIDRFVCKIDGIVSDGHIMRRNMDTGEVSYLSSENIHPTRYRNSSGKIFVVVEAKPSASSTFRFKYQLVNGRVFYRLGASNYFEKTERVYKQSDYESQLRNMESNFNQENLNNISLFEKTLQEKEEKLSLLSSELQQTKQLNDVYQTHLNQAVNVSNDRLLGNYYFSNLSSTVLQENNIEENNNDVTIATRMINATYEVIMDYLFPCLR